MFRYSILSNVLGLSRSGKDGRRQASRQRPRIRPMLEALEDRVVPSGSSSGLQLLVPLPKAGGENVTTSSAVMENAPAIPMAAQIDTVEVEGVSKSFFYAGSAFPFSLQATVADTTNPNTFVDKGKVVFTYTINGGGETTKAGGQFGSTQINGKKVALFSTGPIDFPKLNTSDTIEFDVKYSDDVGAGFKDNGIDTGGSVTVMPRTTQLSLTLPGIKNNTLVVPKGRPIPTVTLSVKVSDTTNTKTSSPPTSPIPVNEGEVVFSVDGSTIIFTINGKNARSFTPQNGVVRVKWTPPGAGEFQIKASYDDTPANFSSSSDGSLLVVKTPKARVKAQADPVQDTFSPNPQTVALNAAVTDLDDPSVTVNEGTVLFTVAGIGTVQGTVSNGTASADITIPGGEATGSYPIFVSFSDSAGDFVDGGDDPSSALTISCPPCAANATNSANQMVQNLNNYLLNLNLQIYLTGLAAINSMWTQLTGQPPPTEEMEGQPLEQLYDQITFTYTKIFTSILPLPQAPAAQAPTLSPEAFAATGGGETFAAQAPGIIGD